MFYLLSLKRGLLSVGQSQGSLQHVGSVLLLSGVFGVESGLLSLLSLSGLTHLSTRIKTDVSSTSLTQHRKR